MKKFIVFLSLASIAVACTNDPKEVKKEVIVVPATPPATPPPTPPPTIIVKEPTEKPTTIILNKEGVKVGTKKVDVSIQP